MKIPNDPYNEIYNTKHGKFCIQKSDAFMARALRELGECGEDESALLCSFLKPGDCAVDVGANVGVLTIPMANTVTNDGCVFAFEPERINFLNLCANIAINSRYSVYPRNVALGATVGSVTIPPVDPWRSENIGLIDLKKVGVEKGNGHTVEIVTLDSFKINPRLIKIDVEKMEAEVLRGAHDTIRRCRPVLYCECWGQNEMDAQIAEITDVPYTGYFFQSNIWRANNFNAVKENNFPDVWSPNVIYIPEGTAATTGFNLEECVKTGIKV